MSEVVSPNSDSQYNISSLDRAIDVLEAFNHEQPELTLSEVVRSTGLHKATAFRILASLCNRQLLSKDPHTNRYRLSLRMVTFSEIAKAHNNFVEEAKKAMAQLRDETRHTIYLSVRFGDHRIDIEQVHGLTDTLVITRLVHPKLLEVGAAGAVMLASTSDEEIKAYLTRTAKQRLATTDVDALWRSIARVRKYGYSESKGLTGLTAVAAPVWGSGNEFLGTMSLILSLGDFEMDRVGMARKLLACTNRLSVKLGAMP